MTKKVKSFYKNKSFQQYLLFVLLLTFAYMFLELYQNRVDKFPLQFVIVLIFLFLSPLFLIDYLVRNIGEELIRKRLVSKKLVSLFFILIASTYSVLVLWLLLSGVATSYIILTSESLLQSNHPYKFPNPINFKLKL